MTASLDGEWDVSRESGLLPPLLGVRKRIRGARGVTALGPLPGVGFDVVGNELRYRGPLRGLVDVLEVRGEDAAGLAVYRGRPIGRFRMRRREVSPPVRP